MAHYTFQPLLIKSVVEHHPLTERMFHQHPNLIILWCHIDKKYTVYDTLNGAINLLSMETLTTPYYADVMNIMGQMTLTGQQNIVSYEDADITKLRGSILALHNANEETLTQKWYHHWKMCIAKNVTILLPFKAFSPKTFEDINKKDSLKIQLEDYEIDADHLILPFLGNKNSESGHSVANTLSNLTALTEHLIGYDTDKRTTSIMPPLRIY
jgi:hypothetical protein